MANSEAVEKLKTVMEESGKSLKIFSTRWIPMVTASSTAQNCSKV